MRIWRFRHLLITAVWLVIASLLGAAASAHCPPAMLPRPSSRLPDLPETLIFAVWGSVVSSIILGGLLGRWFTRRNVTRSRSIPTTLLGTIVVVATWSAAMAVSYPTASDLREDVTLLLQLVLFPPSLVATTASVWGASRWGRKQR